MDVEKPKGLVCIRNRLTILLFLLVLILPFLDATFDLDRAPPLYENRTLADWPASPAGPSDMQRYLQGLSHYFDDHFGFRRRLIHWNNKWRKAFFRDLSKVEVLQGQENWLYFSGGHMVDNLVGTRPFPPETLAKLRDELQRRQDWLHGKGIDYLLVIGPNKETIYPEHLPQWLQSRIANPSKLDQFVEYMRLNSTISILDLRPMLLTEKLRHPVYLKTDSHWNKLGGYLATQSVIEHLRHRNPEYQPGTIDDVNVAFVNRGIPGDLANMLALKNLPDENWVEVTPKMGTLATLRKAPEISRRTWPEKAIPAVSQNPRGRGSLLLFHDSFGGMMRDYLADHFRQAAYVSQYLEFYTNPVFEWSPDVVEHVQPDIVIDEMIEKTLLNITSERIIPTRFPTLPAE